MSQGIMSQNEQGTSKRIGILAEPAKFQYIRHGNDEAVIIKGNKASGVRRYGKKDRGNDSKGKRGQSTKEMTK